MLVFSKEESAGNESKDPIADAAATVDKTFKAEGATSGEEVEEKEEKEEKQEEEKKEDKDEKEEKEGLSAEQLAHAANIYRALQNPATQKDAVAAMAKLAGIELKEIETKKETKEAKDAIEEYVKEELEKYPFLADAMVKILKKAIPTIVEERQKELAEKIELQEEKARQEAAGKAQDKVLAEFDNVDDKLLIEMIRIQEEGELLAGPKSTHESYFRACLRAASDNLKIPLVPKSSKSETKREVKDPNPLNNLHKEGNKSQKEGVKFTHPTTVKEAISLAEQQVEAKWNKG